MNSKWKLVFCSKCRNWWIRRQKFARCCTRRQALKKDRDNLKAFADALMRYKWQTPYEAHGHRITLCDASTGHTVRTVAMCENAETASVFVECINRDLPPKGTDNV